MKVTDVPDSGDRGDGSMHYERAALLSGVKRDVGQEAEEKIGKSAEEWQSSVPAPPAAVNVAARAIGNAMEMSERENTAASISARGLEHANC